MCLPAAELRSALYGVSPFSWPSRDWTATCGPVGCGGLILWTSLTWWNA